MGISESYDLVTWFPQLDWTTGAGKYVKNRGKEFSKKRSETSTNGKRGEIQRSGIDKFEISLIDVLD